MIKNKGNLNYFEGYLKENYWNELSLSGEIIKDEVGRDEFIKIA